MGTLETHITDGRVSPDTKEKGKGRAQRRGRGLRGELTQGRAPPKTAFQVPGKRSILSRILHKCMNLKKKKSCKDPGKKQNLPQNSEVPTSPSELQEPLHLLYWNRTLHQTDSGVMATVLPAVSAGGGASRGQEELSTHEMLVDIWSFVKCFDFCKKKNIVP